MLDDERPFLENLDATLTPTVTPRGWVRRFALLVTTLVVSVVVLTLVFMRGQTTAIAPQGMQYRLLLTSDATWGTFTITANGQRVTLPFTGSIQASMFYSAPNSLQIGFVAPPFAPSRCHLTLPPAVGDTCHSLASVTNRTNDPLSVTSLSVHFRLSVADLPVQMGHDLIHLLDQKVLADTPQVPIATGSHYAVGGILITHYVAQRPLVATLVSARGDPRHSPDLTCGEVCGAEADIAPLSSSEQQQQIWHARVYIAQRWGIRDAAGIDLGGLDESTLSRPLDLDLRYDTASSQWDVASPTDLSRGMCDDGDVFLTGFFFGTNSGFANFSTRPDFEDHRFAGCRLHLPTTDGSQVADFLWRLGSLYAVNALAHTAAPSLAMANAADVAALG
jgi:hypothetical protein